MPLPAILIHTVPQSPARRTQAPSPGSSTKEIRFPQPVILGNVLHKSQLSGAIKRWGGRSSSGDGVVRSTCRCRLRKRQSFFGLARRGQVGRRLVHEERPLDSVHIKADPSWPSQRYPSAMDRMRPVESKGRHAAQCAGEQDWTLMIRLVST